MAPGGTTATIAAATVIGAQTAVRTGGIGMTALWLKTAEGVRLVMMVIVLGLAAAAVNETVRGTASAAKVHARGILTSSAGTGRTRHRGAARKFCGGRRNGAVHGLPPGRKDNLITVGQFPNVTATAAKRR